MPKSHWRQVLEVYDEPKRCLVRGVQSHPHLGGTDCLRVFISELKIGLFISMVAACCLLPPPDLANKFDGYQSAVNLAAVAEVLHVALLLLGQS